MNPYREASIIMGSVIIAIAIMVVLVLTVRGWADDYKDRPNPLNRIMFGLRFYTEHGIKQLDNTEVSSVAECIEHVTAALKKDPAAFENSSMIQVMCIKERNAERQF